MSDRDIALATVARFRQGTPARELGTSSPAYPRHYLRCPDSAHKRLCMRPWFPTFLMARQQRTRHFAALIQYHDCLAQIQFDGDALGAPRTDVLSRVLTNARSVGLCRVSA